MLNDFLKRKGGMFFNFTIMFIVMILWIVSLQKDKYIKKKVNIIKEFEYYEPSYIKSLINYIRININNKFKQVLSVNSSDDVHGVSDDDIYDFLYSINMEFNIGMNNICYDLDKRQINLLNINRINEFRKDIIKMERYDENIKQSIKEFDDSIKLLNEEIANNINDLASKFIKDINIYNGECNKYTKLVNKINDDDYSELNFMKEELTFISKKITKLHSNLNISIYILTAFIIITFIVLMIFTKNLGVMFLSIYRVLIIIMFFISSILFFGIVFISELFVNEDNSLYSSMFNDNGTLRAKYWGESTILTLVSFILISMGLLHIIFVRKSGLLVKKKNWYE